MNEKHRFSGKAISYILAAFIMVYLSFLTPRLLPGDFVTAMYSNSHVTLTAQQEAELKAYYSQNEGFGEYLARLARFDWGYSYAYLTPASELIFEALPWTLLLMGGAHLISMFLGFVAGVEAAWRRGGMTEKFSVGLMTVLEGIPEIGMGVILLVVFALGLQWFPAGGAETAYAQATIWERACDVVHHLTLPLATLVIAFFPGNFLLTRGGMVMVLKDSFMLTARAKGLPPVRIRYAHAAVNILLPLLTRFGLRFAFMITGALVVETIHSYPGLGTLLYNAISMRDLPLIQSIVLFSSLMVLFITMVLEFSYAIVDPRVKNAR